MRLHIRLHNIARSHSDSIAFSSSICKRVVMRRSRLHLSRVHTRPFSTSIRKRIVLGRSPPVVPPEVSRGGPGVVPGVEHFPNYVTSMSSSYFNFARIGFQKWNNSKSISIFQTIFDLIFNDFGWILECLWEVLGLVLVPKTSHASKPLPLQLRRRSTFVPDTLLGTLLVWFLASENENVDWAPVLNTQEKNARMFVSCRFFIQDHPRSVRNLYRITICGVSEPTGTTCCNEPSRTNCSNEPCNCH